MYIQEFYPECHAVLVCTGNNSHFRYEDDISENTGRRANADLKLGQRRGRWPNINPALAQCPAFSCLSAATHYALVYIV